MIVHLQLDQRAEYVLVLVGILVAGGGREGGRGRVEEVRRDGQCGGGGWGGVGGREGRREGEGG